MHLLTWSKVAWNKAVFSLQYYSAPSYLCCCPTLSIRLKTEAPSTQGVTWAFSTLHACAQTPECAKFCFGDAVRGWCCLHCTHWGSLTTTNQCFAYAYHEFGLTITLNKTNILGQDISRAPCILLGDHTLEVAEDLTYLGFIISSSASLYTELNTRIDKAASARARLTKRLWENSMLFNNAL